MTLFDPPHPQAERPGGLPRRTMLRWLEVDAISAADWPRLRLTLNAEERARADRFRRPIDAAAFTAAHALLRACLSISAGPGAPPPTEWRFATGPHGKPHLAPPSPPCFNLSHTTGAVAVAIGPCELGVDIERLDPARLDRDVANALLAPAESRLLDTLGPGARLDAAFAIWTLKEAYAKARGLGLLLPFDSFAVALDPPRLCSAPQQDPAAWRFELRRPTPGVILALAQPAHAPAVDARAMPPAELLAALSAPIGRPSHRCSDS